MYAVPVKELFDNEDELDYLRGHTLEVKATSWSSSQKVATNVFQLLSTPIAHIYIAKKKEKRKRRSLIKWPELVFMEHSRISFRSERATHP